ncbi:MAG: 5-deoxy-glucuronate isomerase [Chloroflexi bacterium]|nr:MAG: 5-deoxy-glucuronate isomerase [Chloroflexota bacterium]
MNPLPDSAPSSDLRADQLRLRPGVSGSVAVDPTSAGWRYLTFRVHDLKPDEKVRVGGAGEESAIVTVSGAVSVELDRGGSLDLPGRPSVWDGLPWAAYLPPGCLGMVRANGPARIAVASAPGSGRTVVSAEPVVIGPEQVGIEVRGAGNATRQVNHIITPDFPADRLELVEVYTPSGNWSSWPPHKHDTDAMPGEAVLEEVYSYAFRRPEAWGIQRLYRRDGSRDVLWAVRDGEVVVVTDGYHPFVATHGDDAYYLNALAGDRRTMACSFDPDLDWVREGWAAMEPDPRLPLVGRT